MASLDLTAFDSALKQYYTNDKVEQMVYQDHPFLALVPKREDFYGRNLPIPIQYGVPQGRSATFATAKDNKLASKFEDFVLTRVKDYALASIDNETLEASQNDAGAFLEAATNEIDSAFLSASRSMATSLFRDGSGKIGTINTTVTGTTLTLEEPNDIVNFEVGMEIQFANPTGPALRDSGEAIGISSVNRDAGTMVVDAALSTISGLTASDLILQEGDISSKVSGLEAWIPSSVTSAAFFGVNRSVDATRLGGLRVTGTGMPIEEALITGANRIAREGGAPNYCFMNYDKFAELEKSLGSKVQYVDVQASAEIGFRGMMIHGPRGPIKVIGDQNNQDNIAWMLDLSKWSLYSLGRAPKILSQDGLRLLRESDADAVEVRVGYYAQLGCRAPGHNARISLD